MPPELAQLTRLPFRPLLPLVLFSMADSASVGAVDADASAEAVLSDDVPAAVVKDNGVGGRGLLLPESPLLLPPPPPSRRWLCSR